jgi:hypothetical protein
VLLEQPPLIYAVDLVQVVTGKNSEDAAKALRDLPADLYLPEKISCRSIRLPSGTKKVKFVTYEDALELVMVLGGKQAKIMKTQFAKTLTRFFAGDSSLAQELRANATSTAPLNALARESETVGFKRVRDENDEDERRLEVVKATRVELDEVAKVVEVLEPKLTQQKKAVVFMLPYVEKICEVQSNLEHEKQKTYSIEGKTAEEKARIQVKSAEDLGRIEAEQKEQMARIEAEQKERMAKLDAEHKERMAKLEAEQKARQKQDLIEEREAELAFLEKKRLVLEGPLPAPAAPTPAAAAPILVTAAPKPAALPVLAPIFVAPSERRALKSIYGKLYASRIDPFSFGIMAGHVRGCYQDKYHGRPEKCNGNDMYPMHAVGDVEGWIREWTESDRG